MPRVFMDTRGTGGNGQKEIQTDWLYETLDEQYDNKQSTS